MLLAAASFGLSAAPEFAEMPVGTDGAWLIRGRGEVDAKLGRGPAGGREEAVSLSYDFSRCPDRRNSFARVEFGRDLVGMPQEFSLELRSDVPERELPLALWIHDRSGEVYLMRFKFRGDGWQTVKVPMMRAAAWKSGDGNGKPDLPLRFAEFGTVYRYEQSGELHGLTRVRGFTQDDAHIFCRPDQLKDEFMKVIDIVLYIFKTLSFDQFTAQISLRDPNNKEKYIGSDENWEKAESAIMQAAKEKGLTTVVELGEAAFYGPKLDFMVKDAIGRKWQLGTIQVDYNLPERFDLTYKGADDRLHRPIMIHRAPFGSMERFVAVLLEHTGGKFPLWLSPQQVVVLPISEKFNDYAQKVSEFLNRSDVRTEVDDRNEKIGRKIRDNELKRIPYLLIVGEKEEAEGLVSVRAQGEGDKGQMTLEGFRDFIAGMVKEEIEANKMEKK